MTMNAIKADLAQYHGGGPLFHGMIPQSNYSPGARAFFVKAKAWWLYDIIQTEVLDTLKKNKVLDTFYFKIKAEGAQAKLTLRNYKDEVLLEKDIEFTTMPDGEIELVCGWDGHRMITCLHSEN